MIMPEQVYEGLMIWPKKTRYGLPEADEVLPLIEAAYTPEEACLLTGLPFSGRNESSRSWTSQEQVDYLDPALAATPPGLCGR